MPASNLRGGKKIVCLPCGTHTSPTAIIIETSLCHRLIPEPVGLWPAVENYISWLCPGSISTMRSRIILITWNKSGESSYLLCLVFVSAYSKFSHPKRREWMLRRQK
jgi:hypothetical protein